MTLGYNSRNDAEVFSQKPGIGREKTEGKRT
jgi:hypothetical protein